MGVQFKSLILAGAALVLSVLFPFSVMALDSAADPKKLYDGCTRDKKADSCFALGHLYFLATDPKLQGFSNLYFKTGCEIQKQRICSREEARTDALSSVLLASVKKGPSEDRVDNELKKAKRAPAQIAAKSKAFGKKAKRSSEMECEGGDATSCLLASLEQSDRKKSRQLLKRGCTMGDKGCCDFLKGLQSGAFDLFVVERK